MKKHILRIAGILAALTAVLFLALRLYVGAEERKRSDAPGNADAYKAEALEKHAGSPLEGKTIIFLGSSVTYGAAAEGQSFVELFGTLDGARTVKEAKSGTTLVDRNSIFALLAFGNGDSYVRRLKTISQDTEADCVVVQLSTNDATMKLPLGETAESKEMIDFDTKTVTGAMEWIIRYSLDTWNCPVVFYTGSFYDSPEYSAMVDRLYELKEKWDIGIIDLYTDREFNEIDAAAYAFYMYDPIHPTRAGYVEWWFPRMEEDLTRILAD